MSVRVRPQFLWSGTDRRFGIWFEPDRQAPQLGLLVAAPFADEMNKARRMMTLTARALAARGIAVLHVDLLGTGDSPGELADADWPTWQDDLRRAHALLSDRVGSAAHLWGMRTGALLAAAVAPQCVSAPDLLLWQPTLAGATWLTQFLRLKVAADALSGAAASTTRDLQRQLEDGATVDVAGYRLPGRLATAMSGVALDVPPQFSGQVDWLEVSPADPPTMSPAAQSKVTDWQQRGITVRGQAVVGPPFWQTQEIETCPALINATVSALTRRMPHAAHP